MCWDLMEPVVVTTPFGRIVDWATLHDVLQRALAPRFLRMQYGRLDRLRDLRGWPHMRFNQELQKRCPKRPYLHSRAHFIGLRKRKRATRASDASRASRVSRASRATC